jgi:capsular exopolysaccharide synthesis family protein
MIAGGVKAPDNALVNADMRGLLLIVWRRRILITGILLIGASLAVLAVLFMRPHYSARALLMVNISAAQGVAEQIEGGPLRGRFDSSLVLGEVEILRSRTMARSVIERLNLLTDPEFNPHLRGKGRAEARMLTPHGFDISKLPPEVRDRAMADTVARFSRDVNVRPVPGSYAIQLEFTSGHPAKAALIANAIADAYIEQSLEQSFAASKKLSIWLDKRLGALRNELRTRELAVERYKVENHILQGAASSVSAAQISEISSQLTSAKAKQAEAHAKLDQIEELLRTPERMESAEAVINSDIVQKLKLDHARKEAELSQLSNRYGPKHPEILKIKSEIAEIKNVIRGEITTMARSVENEVRVADMRVAAIEAGMAETGGRKNLDDERMVGLRALEQEADATRAILDNFLKNYKQGLGVEELQQPSAKIISYAVVPRTAVYPNKMLIISLSCVASLFLGITLSLLLEKLDNAFRSSTQLEAATGLPCFGLIASAGNLRPPFLGRYVLARPASPLAESVRTLRMLLNLRAQSKKPKVITLTSSFPGEGKTTLSLWMARLAAMSGEKVIVIDADLRRPNIHKSSGQKSDATLAEYLGGEKELNQIIRKDADSPAHIIFGRSVPHEALDLVASEKMKALVGNLRETYDLVIIDSPACLAVSDARLLATLSDCVLYAVRWDKTPREAVANGVKHFADIGYGPLVLVLTNVDVKRHARYGYADTAQYYGRYADRYAA